MFGSSKPDLMIFRKNNPEVGVVMQNENVSIEEEESMETGEEENTITLSGVACENKLGPKYCLAQLLGNMEKVAGEMAKAFMTNVPGTLLMYLLPY